MKKITLVLVIAKPGHLRNGLLTLLRTIPQIEILAEAHDTSVLMKLDDEIHPELILLDASLIEGDRWTSLEKTKTAWSGTKVLVLAENDQQGKSALLSGADYYLLEGFPATELVQFIETLISDSQKNIDLLNEK